MIIVGEIYNNSVKICLLERKTDNWIYRDKVYFVPAFTPIFIDISLNTESPRTIFEFKNSKGEVQKGSVSNKIESCYVVACNNRHVYYENTIWKKIEEHPVDLLLHLGDQIYADRLFWKWFYSLDSCSTKEQFNIYKEDIERDYYIEYLDTWEPLQNILSHTSSILIPDDHEARSRADIWTENVKESVANKLGENIKYYLIDEKRTKQTKIKEEFLFKVAFDLCRKLYIGLRFTNLDHFDYIRKYNCGENEITIILTERITQSHFGKSFYSNLPSFSLNQKVIVASGLPPMPIRENFAEFMVYRHPSTIPDKVYDKFCKKFTGTNLIAIGGDIHLGSKGNIVCRKTKECIGIFHTTGPSSGFTSFHIDKECLGSTDKYEFQVKEFNNRDPNAVYIDLLNFVSNSIYQKSNYNASIINILNTAGVFYKPKEEN